MCSVVLRTNLARSKYIPKFPQSRACIYNVIHVHNPELSIQESVYSWRVTIIEIDRMQICTCHKAESTH